MSLLPPRCFSCNKVLRNLEAFLVAENKDAWFDQVGYTRPCCRRMFLGYPKELDDTLSFYKKYQK